MKNERTTMYHIGDYLKATNSFFGEIIMGELMDIFIYQGNQFYLIDSQSVPTENSDITHQWKVTRVI